MFRCQEGLHRDNAESDMDRGNRLVSNGVDHRARTKKPRRGDLNAGGRSPFQGWSESLLRSLRSKGLVPVVCGRRAIILRDHESWLPRAELERPPQGRWVKFDRGENLTSVIDVRVPPLHNLHPPNPPR